MKFKIKLLLIDKNNGFIHTPSTDEFFKFDVSKYDTRVSRLSNMKSNKFATLPCINVSLDEGCLLRNINLDKGIYNPRPWTKFRIVHCTLLKANKDLSIDAICNNTAEIINIDFNYWIPMFIKDIIAAHELKLNTLDLKI